MNLSDQQTKQLTCGFLAVAGLILLYCAYKKKESFQLTMQQYATAAPINPGPGLQIQGMQQANGIIGLTGTKEEMTAVDMDYIGNHPYDGQNADLSQYLGQYYQRPYVANLQ